MNFQEFIDVCSKKMSKQKLYFEHHYAHYDDFDYVNTYKCHIIGTNYKICVEPNNDIYQFYNHSDFENCRNFDECLNKLIEVVKENIQ